MSEGIAPKNIQLMQHATDWENAIRLAARPLVAHKSIEPTYVDKMVESVHKLGPYIVIMQGLALAHSAPCPEVLHSDLSLATLAEPVEFHCKNDPVSVVMCLACTDSTSHIARLQSIAGRLMEPGIVERMVACRSPEELSSLLQA